jgi:hypothetical protein
MSWQVTSGKIPTGRGVGQIGFADAAETGSGSVVRATSPTVTNPVVGTQSPGDNTTKAASTAFVTSAIAAAGITGFPLQGYINGLTLSTAGGSGTMGIAAGLATDTTNAAAMTLASAYTKTTAAWAVGTGNGGIDTGAIANTTWYHWWLIQRSDTGVVDVLFSLSPTAPTMPASYDRKRRLGAAITDGAAHWVKFVQTGNRFIWNVLVRDVNLPAWGSTAAQTVALTVPTGVAVEAIVNFDFNYVSGAGQYLLVTSLNQTDTAPGAAAQSTFCSATNPVGFGTIQLTTDTAASIRFRMSVATALVEAYTRGWVDAL